MSAFITMHASLRRIGIAVLSLAALLAVPATSHSEGFPANSMSGVKATAIIAQGYYMQVLGQECIVTSSCKIVFSAVPSGKTLIVSYVSCKLQVSGTAPATAFVFTTDDDTALANLTPVLLGTANLIRAFNTSDQVLQIARSGKKPIVAVQFGTQVSTDLKCSIAGQLKP